MSSHLFMRSVDPYCVPEYDQADLSRPMPGRPTDRPLDSLAGIGLAAFVSSLFWAALLLLGRTLV